MFLMRPTPSIYTCFLSFRKKRPQVSNISGGKSARNQTDFAFLAKNAWPLVQTDLQWFIDHGKGKKMYFDEVGRSSNFSDIWY